MSQLTAPLLPHHCCCSCHLCHLKCCSCHLCFITPATSASPLLLLLSPLPSALTMLKSAEEQYDLLDSKYTTTRRTTRQKKGKGTHFRVFHWMPTKSIKPLAALPEVKTLEGSVTMKSHFFWDVGRAKTIGVREIACLNCNKCRCTADCDPLLLVAVQPKSSLL